MPFRSGPRQFGQSSATADRTKVSATTTEEARSLNRPPPNASRFKTEFDSVRIGSVANLWREGVLARRPIHLFFRLLESCAVNRRVQPDVREGDRKSLLARHPQRMRNLESIHFLVIVMPILEVDGSLVGLAGEQSGLDIEIELPSLASRRLSIDDEKLPVAKFYFVPNLHFGERCLSIQRYIEQAWQRLDIDLVH